MRNALPATLRATLPVAAVIVFSTALTGCNADRHASETRNISYLQQTSPTHYGRYIYSLPDVHNHRTVVATQATLISRHPIH